jgi:hypothetical protein
MIIMLLISVKQNQVTMVIEAIDLSSIRLRESNAF